MENSASEEQWYWSKKDSDERNGPVGREQLEELVEAGDLESEDLVWRDGFDDWKEAGSVGEIEDLFASPPPLPDDPSGENDEEETPPPIPESEQSESPEEYDLPIEFEVEWGGSVTSVESTLRLLKNEVSLHTNDWVNHGGSIRYSLIEIKEVEGKTVTLEAPSGFNENMGDKTHHIEFGSVKEKKEFLEIYRSYIPIEPKNELPNLPESKPDDDGKAPKSEATSCVHDYDEDNICQKCGWSETELKEIDGSKSDDTEKSEILEKFEVEWGGLVLTIDSTLTLRRDEISLVHMDDEEVALSYERVEVKETDGREIVLEAPTGFDRSYDTNQSHSLTFSTKGDAEKAVEIIESRKNENRSEEDSEGDSAEKSLGGDSSQRIESTEPKDDPSTPSQNEFESDSKAPESEAVSCVHDYDEDNICQKCGWSKTELKEIEESKSEGLDDIEPNGADNKNEEPNRITSEKSSDQKDKKEEWSLRSILEMISFVIMIISLPVWVVFSVMFFWRDKDEVYKESYYATLIFTITVVAFFVYSVFTDPSEESRAASACAEKVRKEYEDPTLYGRMKPETGMADESSDYPGQVLSLEEDEYLVSGFAATEYIDPEGLTGDAYSGYAFSCKVEVTKDAADIVSFQAPEPLNEK